MRVVIASLALVVVAGCGSSGPAGPSSEGTGANPGPEAAARQLIESLERGDCPAAQKVVLDPSALECTVVADAKGSLADDGISLDGITYTPSDVVDDSATVSVDLGNDEAAVTLNVERVDGAWKAVYDTGV